MSNLNSIRIKQAEKEMLEIWMDKNRKNMEREYSHTEIIHHFIYLGLCNTEIDENGKLRIR
tara:strand:- start:175 stop:357 length:183 start_codon:yes stop_codon:yes gene_type:complete